MTIAGPITVFPTDSDSILKTGTSSLLPDLPYQT